MIWTNALHVVNVRTFNFIPRSLLRCLFLSLCVSIFCLPELISLRFIFIFLLFALSFQTDIRQESHWVLSGTSPAIYAAVHTGLKPSMRNTGDSVPFAFPLISFITCVFLFCVGFDVFAAVRVLLFCIWHRVDSSVHASVLEKHAVCFLGVEGEDSFFLRNVSQHDARTLNNFIIVFFFIFIFLSVFLPLFVIFFHF